MADKPMTFWCTMAEKYRDKGGIPRVYCKFLGKMVELEYCRKECTDRVGETLAVAQPEEKE